MIISCPACKKNFEIDANLITSEGRNLQCGSCLNVWFYKPEKNILDLKIKDNTTDQYKDDNEIIIEENIKRKISTIKKNNNENRKDKALVKYEKKTKLSLSNLVGYFIVLILSFVALIIFLDTFQALLSTVFPNLELILFNFYETLIDIYLFTKDLLK